MLRSVTREDGLWRPGEGVGPLHFPRMCQAGDQVRHMARVERVTYIENPAEHHRALLVDTAAWTRGRDDAERARSVIFRGAIPAPGGGDLEASAQALHYGGVRDPQALHEVYLASVIDTKPPTKEELDFMQKAITKYRRDLTPDVIAMYRGKLRLAGRLA